MTLEDIVKAGKKEAGVRALDEAFSQDSSINIVPQIAKVTGDESYQGAGVTPQDFLTNTPAQNREILNTASGETYRALVDSVKKAYIPAIDALGKGKDGLKSIGQFLVNIKPVKYKGADEKVVKAHSKAYDAVRADPDKVVDDALKEIKTDTMRKAVAYLVQGRENFAKLLAGRRAGIAVGKFVETLGGVENARGYLRQTYEHAGKEQDNVAYAIGQAVTQSSK